MPCRMYIIRPATSAGGRQCSWRSSAAAPLLHARIGTELAGRPVSRNASADRILQRQVCGHAASRFHHFAGRDIRRMIKKVWPDLTKASLWEPGFHRAGHSCLSHQVSSLPISCISCLTASRSACPRRCSRGVLKTRVLWSILAQYCESPTRSPPCRPRFPACPNPPC